MAFQPAFQPGDVLASLANLVTKTKEGVAVTSPLFTQQTVSELQDRTILIQLLDFDTSTNTSKPSAESLEAPGLLSTEKGLKQFMYFFRNSPDEYVDVRPIRTTVTQTRGGYWVEDFGPGVREIHIKGHTGFRKTLMPSANGGFEELDGKQLKKRLANLFKIYNVERRARYENKRDYRKFMMLFRMYTEEDVNLIVHPTSFQILRSKSNPMIYMYDIKFTVLGEYEEFVSNIKDPIVRTLNDPELRFPRILQNFKSQFTETLGYIIADPALVDSLGGLGTRVIGNLFSIAASLDAKQTGTDDVSKVKTTDADNNKVVSFLTQRESVAYDILGSAAALAQISNGVSSVALSAIAEQDYLKGSLEALAVLPTTDLWNSESIKEFTGSELGQLAAQYLPIGPRAYDTIRGIRQMQACLSSLSLYPELFTKSYESDIAERRKALLDSGCATTLRINNV